MIELTESLLERSPEETSRYLCLGLLEEARVALGRLENGEDPEALHDFRVALRRLRSLMRVYRPYLKGSVGKKLRARLKELAASTNQARDAEVQVEWLQTQLTRENDPASEAGTLEESGASHLLERLREQQSAAPSPETLRQEFEPLQASVRKSLSRVRLRLDEDGRSFLRETGTLIENEAGVLRSSLESISSADDFEKLHRARIEAKRLRYLLEPLQLSVTDVRARVSTMKALQDVLGELQDTRVLIASISEELERAALEQARKLRDLAFHEGSVSPGAGAPAHPGLLQLLSLQRERRDRCYDALSRDWLHGAGAPFFHELGALSSRLTGSGPSEPRRRFLLSRVPEEAKRKLPKLVREGFVSGRRIHESVLAVGTGPRALRLRRLRIDGHRTEERLSASAFERFWQLCDGRRIERHRYEAREGGLVIRIDEVPARGIVLAELEGVPGRPLPPWLEASVVREVTGSKRYEGEALARAKQRPPGTSPPS